MTAILKIRDENGNFTDVPAIRGGEGKSAYKHALEGGFVGTEKEFNKAIAELSPSITPEIEAALTAKADKTEVDALLQNYYTKADIIPITNGGTGAGDRVNANKNIMYIGHVGTDGTIPTLVDDTPTNWNTLGAGYAYVNGLGKVTDQPANYGWIENKCYFGEITQYFHPVNAGVSSYRRVGVAGSGWRTSWVKMLDENNISDLKISKMTAGQYTSVTSNSEESKTKTIDCGIVPRFVLFFGRMTTLLGLWNSANSGTCVFLNRAGGYSEYTAALSGTSLTLTSTNDYPEFNNGSGYPCDWVALG